MEIDRETALIPFAEGGGQHLVFVHVITSVAVRIHFLHKIKIGVLRFQDPRSAVYGIQNVVFVDGFSVFAGNLGAVGHHARIHEKRIVGSVRAEADIIGYDAVGRSRFKLRIQGGALERKFEVVLYPVVFCRDIDDVSRRRQHYGGNQGDKNYCGNFNGFFHTQLTSKRILSYAGKGQ